MVALAGNLDFAGSRFLTCLTAVLIARLRRALAWKVCTLSLLNRCHRCSPFQKLVFKMIVLASAVCVVVCLASQAAPLLADGLFSTADPFLNFAGFLFRIP